jgi:hypothetical protein
MGNLNRIDADAPDKTVGPIEVEKFEDEVEDRCKQNAFGRDVESASSR